MTSNLDRKLVVTIQPACLFLQRPIGFGGQARAVDAKKYSITGTADKE